MQWHVANDVLPWSEGQLGHRVAEKLLLSITV
jgi:hypothetical protein